MFRMAAFVSVISMLVLSGQAAHASLRHQATGPETATAMAGLEGEACPKAEYDRFKTIVCTVEEACGCADTVCKLEWCSDYVHDWRKKFGACLLKGCGVE